MFAAFDRCRFMRHTISVLVENKFGVLTRVAGMFSGRGFNIDTLNVGPTHDPSISRMTSMTARAGFSVEVNRFPKETRPEAGFRMTTSVKVPPMSIPTWYSSATAVFSL